MPGSVLVSACRSLPAQPARARPGGLSSGKRLATKNERALPDVLSGRFALWCAKPGPYLAAINATVVSSMRFENPHSLSYQLDTLTSRPETLVSVSS